MNVKLGDRVKYVGNGWGDKFDKCNTGTVIAFDGCGVGVEFDENIGGHGCSSAREKLRNGKSGHCWFVSADDLKHLKEKSNESIVIYRKGQEVIALDKSTGKTAVAKCSPQDTFDFKVGAKLAFERLIGTPKIVKQGRYEVGDKVKIVDKFTPECRPNHSGKMDKWLGTIMTIKYITSLGNYQMVEDNVTWYWNNHCIEGKVVEESEPKKVEEPVEPFPPGTLVKVNVGNLPKDIIGEIVERDNDDYLIDFKFEYPGCCTGKLFAKKPLPKPTGRWILPKDFKRVDA